MHGDKPIYWHQGLFLQPQHLQLQDMHSHFRSRPVREHAQPHFWGVASLEVLESSLENRRFELLSTELLFPGGTFATFPGNAVISPRSFDEAWVEGEKPFTIYLGLRKWNRDGRNATLVDSDDEAGQAATVYAVDRNATEVNDALDQGPAAKVQQMRYVLKIFWENELEKLDNYHLVPVAQLERSGDEVVLSRNFVPPCLSMDASPWLTRMLKEIRDEISARARQLEAYKSPKASQVFDFDIGYLVFLLALRTLNRYVPLLTQYSEAGRVHPWQVYLGLRQLIGEMTTFSEGISATGETGTGEVRIPPYDHTDLGHCFTAAHDLVGKLLDGITVGPEHLINLTYFEPYFICEIPPHVFSGDNVFWLIVRTSKDARDVTNAMDNLVKLGPSSTISTLLARSVPGIPLEYYSAPPPGLPRRSHSYYYRIEHRSPQWDEVLKSQMLSLYWVDPPEDVSVEIVVLRR